MQTFPSVSPNYSLFETPSYDTVILGYGNRVEQRVIKEASPRWIFKLDWNVLSDADKDLIQQFYLSMQGAGNAFTWNHPKPSQIIGSDSLNYKCIKSHVAASANKPTTGGSWATYWSQTGIDGIPWVTGNIYKYDFIVRFKIDTQSFEYFDYNLWKCNSVELMEIIA